MKLTLDDDTARMSAELMTAFKNVVAETIREYFQGVGTINWSAVTTALMIVSADTNNAAKLDRDQAIQSFTLYLDGKHSGTESDLVLDRLLSAATDGSVDAQTKLALMYERGIHVDPNCAEAFKWYQLAADQGFDEAQNKLGTLYAQGLGVTQDYQAATKWCRLAAEQGLAVAQYNVGLAYSRGTGVPQNNNEAIKWLTLAAEQGLDQAQHDLGWHYVDGAAVEQNYVTALHWYQLAAAQGFSASQNNLGEMYLNGQGVSKDFIKAHMWFSLASSDGDPDSTKSVEDIGNQMTHDQLNMARLLKQDWLKARPKLASREA